MQIRFLPILTVMVLMSFCGYSQNSINQRDVSKILDNQGLSFIQNDGQWESQIKYRASLPEGIMFLTKGGFVYNYVNIADLKKVDDLSHENVDISDFKVNHFGVWVNFLGANDDQTFETFDKRSTYHNYILGDDASKWKGKVPLFGQVKQNNVYNGIDLLVKSKGAMPEYDFIVAPNADPNQIQMQYVGLTPELTSNGDLLLTTSFNQIQEQAPISFQMINGEKVSVASRFKVVDNTVTFEFPEGYDANYELVIDPTLVFCTYSGGQNPFGSSGFYSYATTFNLNGDAFIGGSAYNAGWPANPGAFQTNFAGSQDVCVDKINALGTALLWATYYGGSGEDHPHAMRVDEGTGDLYIAGTTASTNLPTSAGAFQTTRSGPTDVFVLHLSEDGSTMVGGTYLGGTGAEPTTYMFTGNAGVTGVNGTGSQYGTSPVEIMFDAGKLWVVGNTNSSNFPTTPDAQQPTYGGATDGFIVRLNDTLSTMEYGSFLGGSNLDGIYGITKGGAGNLVVVGFSRSSDYPTTPGVYHETIVGQIDGVVTIINPSNGDIIKSTYIGTASNDFALQVQLSTFDNNIYIMGVSAASYPILDATYFQNGGNTFIEVLDPDLTQSVRSTIVGSGGTGGYYPDGFLVDMCGNVYVTGLRAGTNYPVTSDAIESSNSGGILGGNHPFYFCVLDFSFSQLIYGSYFGVSNDHTHCGISRLDPGGVVYHSICNSQQYPYITPGAFAPLYQNGVGSSGQDLVAFKFDFEATTVSGQFAPTDPDSTTNPTPVDTFEVCVREFPYTLNLVNESVSPCDTAAISTWDPGDGTPTFVSHDFEHDYYDTGWFAVRMYYFCEDACIPWDSSALMMLHIVKIDTPHFTTSVTDTIVCDPSDSLKLWVNIENRTDNMKISWAPEGAVLAASPTSDTVWVDPTQGPFHVRVIDSVPGLDGCWLDSVIEINVSFFPRGLEILTNDTTVCSGAFVPINATSEPGYSFHWTPALGVSDTSSLTPVINATTTETYTLTASHTGCVDTSQTIKITVEDYPVLSVSPDFDACFGDEVTISADASPYRSDYTYHWTPTTGLETPNQSNSNFTATESGWYFVSVSSPIGCSDTDSVHITVFPGDFAAFATDTGFCLPDGRTQIWADGGIDAHYKWVPSLGLSNDTIANPIASPEQSTLYTVYVQDVHGCWDTGQVLVSIYPNAVLDLPDSITLYPGEAYHLEPGTNALYFNWYPTNGINDTHISDPTFNPAVRTRYFVTATTENGCTLSDSIDVLVEGTLINMPNAFAPGAGNNNPTFKPARLGDAELIEFNVFNRWGNKVFSSTDINEGWDGTYKGKAQPAGVYIYQVIAQTPDGNKFVKNGNVTLLR